MFCFCTILYRLTTTRLHSYPIPHSFFFVLISWFCSCSFEIHQRRTSPTPHTSRLVLSIKPLLSALLYQSSPQTYSVCLDIQFSYAREVLDISGENCLIIDNGNSCYHGIFWVYHLPSFDQSTLHFPSFWCTFRVQI